MGCSRRYITLSKKNKIKFDFGKVFGEEVECAYAYSNGIKNR